MGLRPALAQHEDSEEGEEEGEEEMILVVVEPRPDQNGLVVPRVVLP